MSGLGIVYYYALGILLVIPVAFYLYVKYAYTYWERIGAPYLVPRFPFGNFGNPVTGQTQATEILKQLYDELKSLGHKHGGSYVFTVPFYIPTHQDYLKNVMSKDFSHFTNRGMYHNEKPDPLSAHRFAIEGEKWKKMRHQLTPAFSPGTIKAMFYIMVRCSTELENLARSYSETKDPLEIKNALSSFTMDVVGSSSFGIDCNSIKDPNSKFLKQGRKFFNFFFFSYFPKLERMIGTRVAPKEMSDFYLNVAKDTVTYRENNKISRKDLIQILIDLKNKPLVHPEVKDAMDSLTVEQIAAQVIVFFLAGFETYSTGMTFCLFELAQNQYIQQRLRDEVNTVLEKYHGEITFDGIQEMKYMDQVFDGNYAAYNDI